MQSVISILLADIDNDQANAPRVTETLINFATGLWPSYYTAINTEKLDRFVSQAINGYLDGAHSKAALSSDFLQVIELSASRNAHLRRLINA